MLPNSQETPQSETDNLSSVHTKETSEHCPGETSYRAKLLKGLENEYKATEQVYGQIDFEDGKDRTDSLQTCRSNAWYAIHLQTGGVRILSDACRLRWCPICSKSRSRVIVSNLEPWLRSCKSPKFLTLTMRHTNDDLDYQIIRLYACFRELRRRCYIKDNIRGGVWFFQVKRTADGMQWHPHLHCALDAEYMPHRVLKQLWKEVTGDSDIVDIRVIHNPKKAAEYIARYAARPAQLAGLDSFERREVVRALHGRRLCGKWGLEKEIRLSKKPGIVQGEYLSICPFSDLQALVKNSFFASTIREAFFNKKTLPLCWSRAHFVSLIDEMYADNTGDIPPPVKPEQPIFSDDDGSWLLQRYA